MITQEQKNLLLKDFCARLPYGVKLNVKFYDISNDNELKTKDLTLGDGNIGFIIRKSHWIEYKPYLRTMESMTEEERESWYEYSHVEYDCEFMPDPTISPENCHLSVDWLNANHFDYRGLIPMDLALKAPKGMYGKILR